MRREQNSWKPIGKRMFELHEMVDKGEISQTYKFEWSQATNQFLNSKVVLTLKVDSGTEAASIMPLTTQDLGSDSKRMSINTANAVDQL